MAIKRRTSFLGVPLPIKPTPAPQGVTIPEPTPIPTKEQPTNETMIIRDQDTGKVSGITFPDGRTILGSERDIRGLIAKKTEQATTPAGIVEGSQVAQQQQARELGVEATAGLGQQVSPTAQIPGQSATRTALSIPAVAAGVGGGAALGAKGGALIGTALGGPAGTAIGGTIGAVGGGIVGGISTLMGKISLDKRQVTKDAYKVFKTSSARSTELMNLANSGQYNPIDLQVAYNQNLANILEARRELKKQTRTAVGRVLSGASDELIDVESYLSYEPLYRISFGLALQNPNPAVIYQVQPEVMTNETP